MPIKPYYYFTVSYVIITAISTAGSIIAYYFMIRAGKKQPEDVKQPNLLVIAGLINIIAIIARLLIPNLYLYEFTSSEWFFYKTYHFIIWITYSSISLISLGVLIFMFGRKNREIYDNYLTIAGLFMIIAFLLQLIGNYLFAFYIWDAFLPPYPPISPIIWISSTILNELTSTLFISGWIFILVHGKMYDKNLFHVVILLLCLNLGFYIYSSIIYILSSGGV